MIDFFHNWALAVWEILAESGPWLLFGFFIAGLLRLYLSPKFVQAHLSGAGIKPILKASAIGVPLPLCSCSVIPVAASLRERGASRGATASFLISTPEIGVDSFLLSSGLLGVPLTLFRVAAAAFTAFAVGLVIDRTESVEERGATQKPTGKHCAEESDLSEKKNLREALRFGYIELADDVVVSLAAGFCAAGLVTALLPPNYFSDLHVGYPVLLLTVLLISLPTYVCATASTPVAAALLSRGLAPGAVLMFMLAGPATNLATMLVVRQQLGNKALAIYLSGIAFGALIFAMLADAVLEVIPAAASSAHVHGGEGTATIGGIILAALLIWRLAAKVRRRAVPAASRKKDCPHC